MKVSIIIPAYNEQNRIRKTLSELDFYMNENFEDYEILVVDDGSVDDTVRVLKECQNEHIFIHSYGANRGKGGAVKYGIEHAKGDMIMFTDADLPYPVYNIKKATDKFLNEPVDLVLGSRTYEENGQKYPWYRTAMSGAFGLVVRLILGMDVPDTQCGFKCFTKQAAKDIFAKSTLSGWGFDVEIIFIAKKLGYRIGRLNVELFHDNEGSKINVVKDAVTMFKEVLKVRKNNKKGIYN